MNKQNISAVHMYSISFSKVWRVELACSWLHRSISKVMVELGQVHPIHFERFRTHAETTNITMIRFSFYQVLLFLWTRLSLQRWSNFTGSKVKMAQDRKRAYLEDCCLSYKLTIARSTSSRHSGRLYNNHHSEGSSKETEDTNGCGFHLRLRASSNSLPKCDSPNVRGRAASHLSIQRWIKEDQGQGEIWDTIFPKYNFAGQVTVAKLHSHTRISYCCPSQLRVGSVLSCGGGSFRSSTTVLGVWRNSARICGWHAYCKLHRHKANSETLQAGNRLETTKTSTSTSLFFSPLNYGGVGAFET